MNATAERDAASRGGGDYAAALAELTSPAYVRRPAREKQARLWHYVSETPYATLPPVKLSTLRSFFRVFRVNWLRKAFEVEADVRPEREKAFHPFGTCAKVRFVADGDSGWTGIFQSGAVGIARLSLALSARDYAPSAAFKFLVDGLPSEHLLLDQSVDRQTSRDFFERSPTNYTLWPKLFPSSLVWNLINLVLSQIAPVMYQPPGHLAAITSSGERVPEWRSPFQVFLTAPGEVHMASNTTDDFRAVLAEIPEGTVLYRVFGNRERRDNEMVYIGYIVTESRFVASAFGDRVLALRHHRFLPGEPVPPTRA